jgi:hypothetical protein
LEGRDIEREREREREREVLTGIAFEILVHHKAKRIALLRRCPQGGQY